MIFHSVPLRFNIIWAAINTHSKYLYLTHAVWNILSNQPKERVVKQRRKIKSKHKRRKNYFDWMKKLINSEKKKKRFWRNGINWIKFAHSTSHSFKLSFKSIKLNAKSNAIYRIGMAACRIASFFHAFYSFLIRFCYFFFVFSNIQRDLKDTRQYIFPLADAITCVNWIQLTVNIDVQQYSFASVKCIRYKSKSNITTAATVKKITWTVFRWQIFLSLYLRNSLHFRSVVFAFT